MPASSGRCPLSRRTKDDIADLGYTSRAILKLRPVQFTYRQPFADGSRPVQYGLIAEEVAEIMPELVARSRNGDIETVKYHVLPTLLLAEVQRLERARAGAESERDELRSRVETLRANAGLTGRERKASLGSVCLGAEPFSIRRRTRTYEALAPRVPAPTSTVLCARRARVLTV